MVDMISSSAWATARSSRIRPANDREMSRNDENGWSNESPGQGPDSGIAAGSAIRLENTLKVKTRVQIPLGLPADVGSSVSTLVKVQTWASDHGRSAGHAHQVDFADHVSSRICPAADAATSRLSPP